MPSTTAISVTVSPLRVSAPAKAPAGPHGPAFAAVLQSLNASLPSAPSLQKLPGKTVPIAAAPPQKLVAAQASPGSQPAPTPKAVSAESDTAAAPPATPGTASRPGAAPQKRAAAPDAVAPQAVAAAAPPCPPAAAASPPPPAGSAADPSDADDPLPGTEATQSGSRAAARAHADQPEAANAAEPGSPPTPAQQNFLATATAELDDRDVPAPPDHVAGTSTGPTPHPAGKAAATPAAAPSAAAARPSAKQAAAATPSATAGFGGLAVAPDATAASAPSAASDPSLTPAAAASAAAAPAGAAAPAPSAAATADPPPAPAAPAPPAPDQVAQAAAALHVGADGTSHVTIRLDPGELGQVQIRISRAQDGTSSVNVAVERPETLATLQGDLAHLHQALDRAGVPEQRSLSLQLDAGTFQPGSQAASDANAGFTPQGGSQQGARQDRQPDSAFAAAGPASVASPAPTIMQTATTTRLNTGVNITA